MHILLPSNYLNLKLDMKTYKILLLNVKYKPNLLQDILYENGNKKR